MRIGAAILSNNNEEFLKQVSEVKNVDFIQIDLMDGTFTEGQTIWIDSIRKAKIEFPLELHLMINNPEEKLEQFRKVKAETIYFHYEATRNHKQCIDMIRAQKKKVGIALSPKTSATVLRKLIKDIDRTLVVTVIPGTQGQKFDILATKNIAIIRQYNERMPIEVDGGVTPHIARMVRSLGATSVVSGSYLQSQKYTVDVVQRYRTA